MSSQGGRRGPGSNQYQDKPPGPAAGPDPRAASTLRRQADEEYGQLSLLTGKVCRDRDITEAVERRRERGETLDQAVDHYFTEHGRPRPQPRSGSRRWRRPSVHVPVA